MLPCIMRYCMASKWSSASAHLPTLLPQQQSFNAATRRKVCGANLEPVATQNLMPLRCNAHADARSSAALTLKPLRGVVRSTKDLHMLNTAALL